MSRFARGYRILYIEEPIDGPADEAPRFERRRITAGVEVLVPVLPAESAAGDRQIMLADLVDAMVVQIGRPAICWYYTPMMLPFSRQVEADCIVYDCMDELANFLHAPVEILTLEQELLDRADLVFTGGSSIYEAKRHRHGHVHLFPSSVDRPHFVQARSGLDEPRDQRELPRPRLGYYGVIDERFDTKLLAEVADARPDWCWVMLGPVVKIAQSDLPQRDNIFYLGGKAYTDLPAYLGGWDVALMPFAINEATRFISPTKTPEYLAGGRPVVSTSIADVVRHYGQVEGVMIADGADKFIAACEEALDLAHRDGAWLAEVDALLSTQSWDSTQKQMAGLIDQLIDAPIASAPRAMSAS